jgi:hypothetical protein
MAAWIDLPDSRKIGSKMLDMGLQPDAIADVMAYFQSMALDPEIMRPILEAEPRPAVIPPAYAGLVEPLDARDFPPLGGAGDHGDDGGEHEDDAHEDEDAGDHDADDSEAARPGEAAPRLESRR